MLQRATIKVHHIEKNEVLKWVFLSLEFNTPIFPSYNPN